MPRMDQLSSYATTVAGDGDAMRVTYHSTVIVEWTADTITLRTGGWDTVTTRRKMNQAAKQFGLGFGVCREKGRSVVRYFKQDGSWLEGDNEIDFLTDEMTFKREYL